MSDVQESAIQTLPRIMKRVLVVEDNPALRSLLVEILTDSGYETDACWSFSDAKAKLFHETFDLLITNVLLPGGGHGTELAAIADSKGMKHLLVTGHPDQMQALELKKQPYMAKPFIPADLIRRIRRMWERD